MKLSRMRFSVLTWSPRHSPKRSEKAVRWSPARAPTSPTPTPAPTSSPYCPLCPPRQPQPSPAPSWSPWRQWRSNPWPCPSILHPGAPPSHQPPGYQSPLPLTTNQTHLTIQVSKHFRARFSLTLNKSVLISLIRLLPNLSEYSRLFQTIWWCW